MLQDLVFKILQLGAEQLATEAAACDALVALRFPNGIRCPKCGADCDRMDAKLTCRGGQAHELTILVGTPLHTKKRPRIRALLLAIRAFSTSARSVSARELARDCNVPHVTLWRHLLTLRSMLPPTPQRSTMVACASVSKRAAIVVAADRPDPSGAARVVAQTVRTWLNGTFHGVGAQWLSLYLREISARWMYGGELVAGALLELLVEGGAPLTFRRVRALAVALQG